MNEDAHIRIIYSFKRIYKQKQILRNLKTFFKTQEIENLKKGYATEKFKHSPKHIRSQ